MIEIYAISKKTNERIKIEDLYWFEENGIHDFSGKASYDEFTYEIFINGVKVY
jgi:hypothetical protein